MRIIITIDHPADVHFFKHFIWTMQKNGHEIKIAAEKKDISIELLDTYGFEYDLLTVQKGRGFGRIKDQMLFESKLYKIAKEFRPDFITGIGGTASSHISKLVKAKSIIFTDNFLIYDRYVTHPLADIIITPTSFTHDLGKKNIKVESFKELAYLHPDYFVPSEDIFSLMGLDKKESFTLVRFAAYDVALHDVKASGFDVKDKIMLVNELSKHSNVFISSDGRVPAELEKYLIRFPLERMHDALYFANLFVSDSQTMTTEAAVLGTPAVRCNSWVGSKNEMLNFVELEQKYNLIHNIREPEMAIKRCIDLLDTPNVSGIYKLRREKLLSEKVNFTKFLIWLFENYHSYNEVSDMQEYYNIHKNT